MPVAKLPVHEGEGDEGDKLEDGEGTLSYFGVVGGRLLVEVAQLEPLVHPESEITEDSDREEEGHSCTIHEGHAQEHEH